MDLIGIPHRLVIGDRGLKNKLVEYKSRRETESQDIALGQVVSFISEKITAELNK